MLLFVISIHRFKPHGRVSSWFFRLSFVIFCEVVHIIKKFFAFYIKLLGSIGLLFSKYEQFIFQVWGINKKNTLSKISQFIRVGVKLLEFFVRSLDNFVKVNNFKLFKLFGVWILYKFVNFSETFAQSWVEMIFDTVVCPEVIILKYLPLSC